MQKELNTKTEEMKAYDLFHFQGQPWLSWFNYLDMSALTVNSAENQNPDIRVCRLQRQDMGLFGMCPENEQFCAVVCSTCGAIVKPQGLQRHLEMKHKFDSKTTLLLPPPQVSIKKSKTVNPRMKTEKSIPVLLPAHSSVLSIQSVTSAKQLGSVSSTSILKTIVSKVPNSYVSYDANSNNTSPRNKILNINNYCKSQKRKVNEVEPEKYSSTEDSKQIIQSNSKVLLQASPRRTVTRTNFNKLVTKHRATKKQSPERVISSSNKSRKEVSNSYFLLSSSQSIQSTNQDTPPIIDSSCLEISSPSPLLSSLSSSALVYSACSDTLGTSSSIAKTTYSNSLNTDIENCTNVSATTSRNKISTHVVPLVASNHMHTNSSSPSPPFTIKPYMNRSPLVTLSNSEYLAPVQSTSVSVLAPIPTVKNVNTELISNSNVPTMSIPSVPSQQPQLQSQRVVISREDIESLNIPVVMKIPEFSASLSNMTEYTSYPKPLVVPTFTAKKANLQQLYKSPYKWLMFSENFEDFNNEHDLEKFDILLDSAFYIAEKINDTEFSLNEIFKFNKSRELMNRVIDTWTIENGFKINDFPIILSRRRRNIMGTLIVGAGVIVDNSSLNHLQDYRKKHIDSITKENIILVNMLIDYFNGTKKFEYFDSWGYKKPTEKYYSGMLGALQSGDADIGCTSLFVNNERLEVIDYMSWTTPTAIQFIFRQPPLSYVTNLFTLPFSRTVWISIGALFLLTVFLIYIVTLWERNHMEDRPEEDDSLLAVVMLGIGAVCQQGTTYEPKSGAGKVITFFTFLALLFIYTSYSAYIVVLLQSISTQIQTLEDMLRSQFDYGLWEAPYNHFYFENATEPIRKEMYEKKILPKGDKIFMTLDEGVKKIREGFFAFHAESPAVYTVIGQTFLENEKCSLQFMQYIEASQFWLPCRKKSSFKEIFKVCLRKLAERGFQSRESNRIFDPKPKCYGTGNNFVSVGLIDAGPAFAFLGAGFAVAFLVFIFEHLSYRVACCNDKIENIIKYK